MTLQELFEDILKRISEILQKKSSGKISIEINTSQGGIGAYDFGFKEKVK